MAEGKRQHDIRRALRVSSHVDIEDVKVRWVFFQQPADEATLDEFHTEYFAEVQSLGEGELVIEVGYRLARHTPESGQQQLSEGEEVSDDPEILGITHFLVKYSYEKEPDQEDLPAFAHHNAILNTWPYWRERVQSTAAAMGLPTLVVPVHHVPMVPSDPDSSELA